MLIALAIFGMLTAAGVALLSVSARTQETSDRLLAEFGQVRRLHALLTADLGQAAPRLWRNAAGEQRRAFTGGGGGSDDLLLLFVRRGADDDETAPGVQRVGYRFTEGQVQRIGFSRTDGAGTASVSPLLDGVRAVRLRYRDERGEWRGDWNEPDPLRLPSAVELVADTQRYGALRLLIAVGGAR